jgi:hypothetical protein
MGGRRRKECGESLSSSPRMVGAGRELTRSAVAA